MCTVRGILGNKRKNCKMKKTANYSNENIHFYNTQLPKLLKDFLENKKINVLADIGCGDGQILYALYETGLISDAKVYAIDISEKRIERVTAKLTNVNGFVSDARKIPSLPNSSLELIINSQVIEHIEDQETMLHEFHRLLNDNYHSKEGGYLYISSIIKNNYAVYIYRNNGKFVLDPTHVSEFKCLDEFVKKIENCGFKIIKTNKHLVTYPVFDGLLRIIIYLKFINPETIIDIYKNNLFRLLRLIKIPIIGFYFVEAIAEKITIPAS